MVLQPNVIDQSQGQQGQGGIQVWHQVEKVLTSKKTVVTTWILFIHQIALFFNHWTSWDLKKTFH